MHFDIYSFAVPELLKIIKLFCSDIVQFSFILVIWSPNMLRVRLFWTLCSL